jgi:Kef-type K+ transport system membrane component KefB
VYIGGLHTSFQSLKANLLLSSAVALTGIAVPVGLSYTLQGLLNATPLQAFAAGAALCSTSLGTTFTVLASSGLSSSRLGVVLTSAAMMDDVVGLVMVQVISNLGGASFSWVVVVRPILVSVAFALVAPIACLFVAKPTTLRINRYREAHPNSGLDGLLRKPQTAFVLHTVLLVSLVVGATYAGTSNLFAAYIAGASISWWNSEVSHPFVKKTLNGAAAVDEKSTTPTSPSEQLSNGQQGSGSTENSAPAASNSKAKENTDNLPESQPADASNTHSDDNDISGPAIYHRYYHPAVSKILQPLFFASIGFSIPITRMFRGAIVWRGIVYTILMILGKLACGLWLVRFSITPSKSNTVSRVLSKLKLPAVPHFWSRSSSSNGEASNTRTRPATASASADVRSPPSNMSTQSSANPAKPFSLHPPLILALAMCARGEIGFLISGVAESKGIFASATDAATDASDIFLVVTWAIVLCTIVGPLGVGFAVKRVKTLEERRNGESEGSGRDVLGVWGVE